MCVKSRYEQSVNEFFAARLRYLTNTDSFPGV
jgi:hypothetical protein